VESNGELNRLINVVKSRGSKTSNQIKEFTISDDGISVEDPYIGEGELVVGSARVARMEKDREEAELKLFELKQVEETLDTLRDSHDSRVKVLNAEFEREKSDLARRIEELKRQADQVIERRKTMKEMRE
jgi:circadian clock protein KaiC